ncbi:MAG: ethanolamine ammonia-lyase reactivating factor EutA [Candidatus Limnocylindria bacterium]
MSTADHWHDHPHDEELVDTAGDQGIAATIWAVDNVELSTVGIDIGSATSHLMFSRLHLQRRAQGYSSRFVVVERDTLYRSSILLTPYQSDGLIDAGALETFFTAAYAEAGLRRQDVDAGAVILTGVALERDNARRIAELFAEEGGRFVCASAGHSLEALLAAHGSGTVARSSGGEAVLNIDVGGGTTKYALCQGGQVLATMAIWGGSRLLVLDDGMRVLRAEPPVASLGAGLGLSLTPGAKVDEHGLRSLAEAIAARIVGAVAGEVEPAAHLAGGLPSAPPFERIVFSGGVAEYLRDGAEPGTRIGDLGPVLATALQRSAATLGVPIEVAAESIRATVTGASQFSLQLSGNTIHLSGPIQLPVHNVPVVAIDLDGQAQISSGLVVEVIERRVREMALEDRDESVAMAVSWSGEPRYAELRALAEGIASAHLGSSRRAAPLMVVLEADVGASLGAILRDELEVSSGVIAIDGVEVADLDFIDIGERILPANVVPVVIKSLIFPHGAVERPRILGSV